MSEDRKAGPGIRTKPHAIRDRAMAIDDAAKRGAEKARFAQRRAKAKPDEGKPESDAVGTVEDTERQLASDVEHVGRSLIRRASAASRKKREAARISEERESSTEDKPAQEQGGTDQKTPQANSREKEKARQEPTQSRSEATKAPGHEAPQSCSEDKGVPVREVPQSHTDENKPTSKIIRHDMDKPTDLAASEPIEAPTPSQPDIAAEKRNHTQSTPDVRTPDAPTVEDAEPRRARQNRSKLKRKDAVASDISDATHDTSANPQASIPRSRMLSADELESARERKFGRNGIEAKEGIQPNTSETVDVPSKTGESNGQVMPRTRQQKADLYHERPALQLPKEKETLHEPLVGSRVIESAPRVEIKTAEAGAKAAGTRVNAAASAAREKVGDEAGKKVAAHMKELSRKAAERSAKALKQSAKSALRAVRAAGQALVKAITGGSGVVVVIIMVILMCASILSSPFGIFTHSDGIENPDSYTLTKAIADINEEYVNAVKSKARGADNVSILIEGNLEGDIEPMNWVDVLGVFAVHVTMREDNAMNVVDLDEAQLKELRTVFWDMNQISVEKETEDGETTTYVLGKSLDYMDMVEKYHFTEQQVELLNEIMSDEYYAFWSNFISAGMGYGDDNWTDVTTAPDDDFLEDIPFSDADFDEDSDDIPMSSSKGSSFSGSSMKIPKIYQYDYKKTVCRINGENKSASSSGCGATSMCMVIHYLTGNTKATPYLLFKWAYEHGYYNGSGLDHGAVSAMGKLCGVKGKWIGKDGKKIVKALLTGHPVIAHMGPGTFTKGGHYIVLRGVTKDGKILVNDPASSSRSKKAYPLSTILKQGKTSTPFMVCSRA